MKNVVSFQIVAAENEADYEHKIQEIQNSLQQGRHVVEARQVIGYVTIIEIADSAFKINPEVLAEIQSIQDVADLKSASFPQE